MKDVKLVMGNLFAVLKYKTFINLCRFIHHSQPLKDSGIDV